MNKRKLVVLSGAGISTESGLKTFRDMGGLWEEYDVMEVASPEGWAKNPGLVLQFYNERRAQLARAKPNEGHLGLVALEEFYDVRVITQNVDNLHEQAGSREVLHLHGELTKVRSTGDPNLVYDIGTKTIVLGDTCEKGFQLRPHIVWFGEMVPAIEEATSIVEEADILLVIGTSLNVYPAAGLVHKTRRGVPVYLIDPNEVMAPVNNLRLIQAQASIGIRVLYKELVGKELVFG